MFNDPLLPEDMDPRWDSAKKKPRGRSGSFGGGDKDGQLEDEDEDINFDDLNQEEKYQVLQHLYEEY